MWTYLIINFLIISIPLLFSFEKRLSFYKNYKALGLSLLLVGTLFISWDIVATYFNHWGFNPKYISGFKITNLPVEEILFFITVPYSCIFIYESLEYFLKGKDTIFKRSLNSVIPLIGIACLTIGLAFNNQYYTATIFILLGITLLGLFEINPELFRSKTYWFFIAITYLPFFIVNYFLTSIPVVIYNSNAIWGIRITTIPLEDFFYSFTMLTLYLFVYLKFRNPKSS